MWKYVGIVRTNERLEKAMHMIHEIKNIAADLYSNGKLSPALLELRNMALTAELIILSALSRKESRGLNYNLDYPNLDDEHCKHDTVLIRNGHNAPELVNSNG